MTIPKFGWPDIRPPNSDSKLVPLSIRLLWMAAIWATSVTALLIAALVIRWLLK